jgi:glucose/arabinose dehydrogenase
MTPDVVTTPTSTPIPNADVFPDPSSLLWALVVDGLREPLDLQHAGDDRLFVVEQAGVVRVLEGGALREQPLLDIRQRVGSRASEQGLLGLAFHSDFADNGFFYVNYTDLGGDTVIARYQIDTSTEEVDPASEIVLLHIEQPYANHNGGGLAFGPDGYLYVATGDGGSGGDPLNSGQRLDTLLGKLLRLDVDAAVPYAIPADNPFANGGGLPEIWAYGLRNPWRFTFDRGTGDLYIGDVGQNRWEEVDFLPTGSPGGANFGWNLREGSHAFASGEAQQLIDPVAEYDHDAGCSVTGGVVIRDPALSEWQGIYLYGDYCTGTIWGLLRDARGTWQSMELLRTDYRIASFGEDSSGVVYLVDLRGAVYRLERKP